MKHSTYLTPLSYHTT